MSVKFLLLGGGGFGGGECRFYFYGRADFSARKGGFWKGVLARMYASLARGSLSAKCTAGHISPWVLFASSAWNWILQKPPLLKPPPFS